MYNTYMKKKYLTIILMLLVPLFLTACTKGESNSASQQNTNNGAKSEKSSYRGNMLTLLGLGKNLKCTFYSDIEGTVIEGTSYISNKRVRSNVKMTMEIEGEMQEMENYSVIDNLTVYNWGDTTDKGMKMSLDEYKDSAEKAETQSENMGQTQPMNQNYEFNCVPWIVDSSVFEVPTDVEFIDFNQMINNMQDSFSDNMGEMKDTACKACENSPDEATKQQCLEALGCE
jgi:hypothetical protein